MAVKPCQLVLIKRYPLDPKLRKDYEDEYCAGFERNWVHYQSNAMLFNRSDVKRDVLPELPKMPRHQILVNGLIVETAFEMVELIEKKSFGFLIKQITGTAGNEKEYYLNEVHPEEVPIDRYSFVENPIQAMIFDAVLRDSILADCREQWPDLKFDYKELFTQ